MPPEFIGMIQPRLQSETHPADKRVVLDKPYLKEFAQAHEAAGFDRVLIGYYADAPDGLLIGAYVAAHTETLGLLVAHRPGFVSPTLAARSLATLDQIAMGVSRSTSSPVATMPTSAATVIFWTRTSAMRARTNMSGF